MFRRLLFGEQSRADTESLYSDTESELDDVMTLEAYMLGAPIYSGTVMNGIPYDKYITKASKIIPNIPKWSFNRDVDQEHVASIKEGLLAMQYPHLMGSIKLVHNAGVTDDGLVTDDGADGDDGNHEGDVQYAILDGQHRQDALLQILKEDPDFDMDIEVDVYHARDSSDFDFIMHDLFIRANNNKNVQQIDNPDLKIIEVIHLMIQQWKKNIKTEEHKSAYRPNVTKRELFKTFKESKGFATCELSSQELFEKIVALNNELRMMSIKKLFGPKLRNVSSACIEKAKKDNFYLNLDSQYPMTVWIEQVCMA